jgi:putative CRISPR-associated protein (TIGR02619 family)
MRTIINTVGTSLLSNAARILTVAEPGEKELLRFINDNSPEQACAETNSLAKLRKEGDRLIFLHSETQQGRLCAEVLCRYFRSRDCVCSLLPIRDLSYQESRFKIRGLRSLVNSIIQTIVEERKKGVDLILNATGGFKAEIAYATLIGLLFDIPVYYIHEAFKDIIEMPPTPIGWDYSLIAEHEDFFFWIDEEPRETTEVDKKIKQLPPEIRLLLIEEEGFTFLSPAGEVFFQAFRDQLTMSAGYPVLLSAQAHKTYQALEDSVRRRFDREIVKIRSPILRRSGADQVNNCDCLVYPKGRRDERIFFFEKEGTVHICELSRHSDKSYERMIEKGIRKKHYKDFSKDIVLLDRTSNV